MLANQCRTGRIQAPPVVGKQQRRPSVGPSPLPAATEPWPVTQKGPAAVPGRRAPRSESPEGSGPVLVVLPGPGHGPGRLAAGDGGGCVILAVPVPMAVAVAVAVRRLQLRALGDDVVQPGPYLAQRAARLRGRNAVLVLLAGGRQPRRLRPEDQLRPLVLRHRAGLLDELAA